MFSIISLVIIAAVAAAAIWRAISLSRALSQAKADDASLRLEYERQHHAAEVELASTRQALQSLTVSKADAEAAAERRIGELSDELRNVNDALNAERQESTRLATSLSHLEEDRAIREHQLEEERVNRERLMEDRFKNLANEILRQNSADFKEQNEQRLQEILSPLRTNLDDFRKTVTDTYNNEARERFSLTERIRELVDLNNTISREARELTLALRGNNKVQGEWGEMVLESILERSGLQKDKEYILQATVDEHGKALCDESGKKLRPDVVVKYPDGRYVVIDSKVSLTAFIEYINTEDDKVKEAAAARHVTSVKNHVDELSRKKYQNYIGEAKLDFVMMFIPNEPAYMAAMRLAPGLWQDAFEKNVLIVSPTHLVSGLRLIEQLWSRDKVTKNAIKIAEEAGKMYDKFAEFTKDMDKIASALAGASKAHSDAMTKLTTGNGNLVKKAQDLRTLGIKAAKQLARSVRDEEEE